MEVNDEVIEESSSIVSSNDMSSVLSKSQCVGCSTNKHDDENGKLKNKKEQKNKKHRWKPYHKMSWAEIRKLEKNETKRANRSRKKMFEQGQAIAPYNTTQFLMADHNGEEPNYDYFQGVIGYSSNDSSEDYPSDDEYMQRQFTEDYENVHTERINGMSKSELVQEYMLLEGKVEEMEKKFRETRHDCRDHSISELEGYSNSEAQTVPVNDNCWAKIDVFREEIENLRKENERLKSENEKLSQIGQVNNVISNGTQVC